MNPSATDLCGFSCDWWSRQSTEEFVRSRDLSPCHLPSSPLASRASLGARRLRITEKVLCFDSSWAPVNKGLWGALTELDVQLWRVSSFRSAWLLINLICTKLGIMERQCNPTLPPIARLSFSMQRSSPIVSSGMEPLVQSCRGDNERVNQSEVRKGKVFMEECSLLLAQGSSGGRRVQVYLCMRRGLKEMTANPLERRVGGAGEGDKRRSVWPGWPLLYAALLLQRRGICIIVHLSN